MNGEKKRGAPPDRDWTAILGAAETEGLSVGQVARAQGVPYGTAYAAAKRLGVKLHTDDRKRRWDGVRIVDKILAKSSCFPEYGLGDSLQNERVPAIHFAARAYVEPDTIYVVEEAGGAFCKIGVTASNDEARRLRELRLGNPRALSLVFSVRTECALRIERMAHARLWRSRVNNKARTEWFQVSAQEAIAVIRECIQSESPSPQPRSPHDPA